MMNEKKNIDRLFQEKFKDFEVVPNEAVWEKIKARQNQKKKRVLLLPFWYRVAGVAALLTIIFTIGYFSRNAHPVQEIVLENKTSSDEEEILVPANDLHKPKAEEVTISSDKSKTIDPTSGDHKNQNQTNHINITKIPEIFDNIQNAVSSAIDDKPDSSTSETPKTTNQERGLANNSITTKDNANALSNQKKDEIEILNSNDSKIATQNNPETISPEEKQNFLQPLVKNNNDQQTSITQNDTPNKQNQKNIVEESTETNTQPQNTNKKSIFDAIDKEDAIAEEKAGKKWNISPTVAPVYYNSFGNGSPIDTQFADNDKSGQVNLSYGVQVAYTLNERLSIRSGVSKVDLSYSTQDVGFSPSGIVSQNLQSVDYNTNAEAILVSDLGSNQNEFVALDINRDAIQVQNEGLLNQRIGYIEVPLEMKYALVNRKLGVNMIGGVSTLFLQENEILVEAGDFESSIGKATNLNDVSFTGNIGIGVDYKLSNQFQVNLEPIFKYQFNGFSGNAENFRPYYFGVYTGVSFKF
ncbi:hypothetical protein U6A24_16925 [Aquimarina gracilis]|uniref:Outer membrane protein beta-barrel domain-containing protein n=1 Tax=Aquimarina gracilis TaxID=874422 RepID=A0ABU5ZZB0_9FLAO|nr:hypothetical protein [Aquimarina gracilis]MEB3347160.1 hypothetical protein [Aquimarina gracilis]